MNYDEMKNALFMKNQLIFLSKKQLVEKYSGAYYEIFLIMTKDLLSIDNLFIASFQELGFKIKRSY